MKSFKHLLRIFTLAIVLAPLLAGAAEKESGMITQAQGSATFTSGADKEKPVVSFMKIRAGDKLSLGKDAKLQVVYFKDGRQETWQGPATLLIGASESTAAHGANPPLVKKLPAIVLQQLTRAPGVVSDLKNRSGMIMVRSLPMLELRKLDENYTALRKEAAEDDVTPELYMLAGLHELKLYRDMKPVLEDMRKRQPNNPEVQAVYDRYSKLMNPPAPEAK
jgi:hypothetical protein